jgi:hypothetical protein
MVARGVANAEPQWTSRDIIISLGDGRAGHRTRGRHRADHRGVRRSRAISCRSRGGLPVIRMPVSNILAASDSAT